MNHLTERELEIVSATAKSVIAEAGHICHFPEDQRKSLHELVEKDRIPHLVEIADTAEMVGIKADGHAVIFSVGKQVTIIGQKAISWVLITIGVMFVLGLIVIFGWKPLMAVLSAVKAAS